MDPRSAQLADGVVTPAHAAFYWREGFLVAPDLLSAAEVAELRRETAAVFRGERGRVEGLVPVAPGESDDAIMRRYVAIHFPHKLSPLVRRYLAQERIVEVLTRIVSPNVKCMQSMLFVKAPGKPGQSWHQDEYYIPTRDCSLTGVWIALDDATLANGCLWVIPGSHRPAWIMPRAANTSGEYQDVDTVDVSAWPPGSAVPVEVKAGAVVFFNGYLLHSSLRNTTAGSFRRALVNHYMSAESMLPWDQDGKLPGTQDLRDIVMVAGRDPYAHRGTVDLNHPFLRPDVLDIKVTP
jgi:phytanoyl-CoA hydroxylase